MEAVPLRDHISLPGRALLVLCALVAASAFAFLRPSVGGLSVHPYVAVLILLLPNVVQNIARIPRHFFVLGGLFLILAGIAMIDDVVFASEIVKLATAGVTVLACALAIRTEKDFLAATVALIAASCTIAAIEFITGNIVDQTESMGGVNFMHSIGNKNVFSLYALPPILLGGYAFTSAKFSAIARALVVGGTAFLALAIFMTANRSGWVGVFLIVAMLVAARFRVKTTIFAAIVLAVVYLVATRTAAAAMIEHRVDQTRGDYSSDQLRESLLHEALEIGLENPAFGVGPTDLTIQLARRTIVDVPMVDPHNVAGYLVGAFGFPAALTFLALTLAVFLLGGIRVRDATTRSAQNLVRMIVVLFWVRGMFSREILYAPAVDVALGIAIGLFLLRSQVPTISSRPSGGTTAKPRYQPSTRTNATRNLVAVNR
jgi:hypothetical protein